MRRTAQRLAVTSLLALTAAAAAPSVAGAASCSGADRSPAELGQSATIRTTLCLLNKERASRGLSKLRADSKLRRAADGHAGDMVAKRYFDHDSKSGATFVTRIKRTGWTRSRRSWTVGENIGYGSGSLRDAALDGRGLDEELRPPREHPRPPVPHDRHRRGQRRPDRRQRRDLRHRLRRLTSARAP